VINMNAGKTPEARLFLSTQVRLGLLEDEVDQDQRAVG
jgi:hypothetical protein